MKKTLAILATVFGLLLCLVLMQRQRLNTMQERFISEPEVVKQNEMIAANLAIAQNMPTLGFDNLIADWFFLQFLQYLGNTEAREKTDYSLSADFFRAIIPNDPFYRLFYFFMSVSTSTLAADPEASVDLMAQGLTYLSPTTPSDSFFIWRYKGIDELLFLGDGVAAQQSFQTAADWAQQSPHPEATIWGPNSQATADFLVQNTDSKTAQVNAWASVYINTFDDNIRQLALDRIRSLGGDLTFSDGGAVNIMFPQDD